VDAGWWRQEVYARGLRQEVEQEDGGRRKSRKMEAGGRARRWRQEEEQEDGGRMWMQGDEVRRWMQGDGDRRWMRWDGEPGRDGRR
jgi:hypothetical protein